MTHHTHRRIATVALAPAVALSTWAVIRLVGVDLVVSSSPGTVGPADVVVAALVAALAGWLVASLLERHSRRPRLRWALVGSNGLAVSIIGPTWLADGSSAVALMSLHVVTAVVVIAGFAGTLPHRRFAAGHGQRRLRATTRGKTVSVGRSVSSGR